MWVMESLWCLWTCMHHVANGKKPIDGGRGWTNRGLPKLLGVVPLKSMENFTGFWLGISAWIKICIVGQIKTVRPSFGHDKYKSSHFIIHFNLYKWNKAGDPPLMSSSWACCTIHHICPGIRDGPNQYPESRHHGSQGTQFAKPCNLGNLVDQQSGCKCSGEGKHDG